MSTFKRASRIENDYGEDWEEISREVKARFDYRCSKCDRHQKEINAAGEQLQVHHIRELTHNGTNSRRNLKPLCTRCHKKEHRHLQHYDKRKPGRRKLFKAKRYYGL